MSLTADGYAQTAWIVLGCAWVLSDSASLSVSWLPIYISIISFDPLSYASQLLLFSLSHSLCVAPCVSLFAIFFGWFHPLKESCHNVSANMCVSVHTHVLCAVILNETWSYESLHITCCHGS